MTEQDKESLISAIRSRFDGAEVQAEEAGRAGRFRFHVVAPEFRELTQLQRQDAVWQVVDHALSREASLDVSLILTYSPADLAGTEG